jgi:hypothetical protein
MAHNGRTIELIFSMCGANKITSYSCLQLEDCRTPLPYIATSPSEETDND